MPAVTQRVDNYLGGVSRQSDDKKLPGQVEECINGYPDPTFGFTKDRVFSTQEIQVLALHMTTLSGSLYLEPMMKNTQAVLHQCRLDSLREPLLYGTL